jgi:pyridoxine/pyridoxamine 5'-phosphate oxidase
MNNELTMGEQTCDTQLETILEQCWTAFRTGANKADSPWRLPIVGTAGASGAELRTVVLRAADENTRSLVFHTDARSQKAKELEKSGQAAWLFFNPQSGVQIRAQTHVTLLQHNDTARKLWEQVPAEAQANYSSALTPGEPVKDQPLRLLNDDETFQNFMVVQCKIDFLDWLQISEDGHQRAQFNWDGHAWNGVQVAP